MPPRVPPGRASSSTTTAPGHPAGRILCGPDRAHWILSGGGGVLPPDERVTDMSNRMKFVIGGVAVGILALLILPFWVGVLIIAAAIAIPAVGYFMLDPSQRRRLRRAGRKQIGH